MIKEVTDYSLTFKREEDGSTILHAKQQLDKEKNVCVVYLKGDVTNKVFSSLTDELYALLSVDVGVILDMKEVTYLSPGFMEALIGLEHRAEQSPFDSMPIQNVSKTLFEEFRNAGFNNSLDIELQEDV